MQNIVYFENNHKNKLIYISIHTKIKKKNKMLFNSRDQVTLFLKYLYLEKSLIALIGILIGKWINKNFILNSNWNNQNSDWCKNFLVRSFLTRNFSRYNSTIARDIRIRIFARFSLNKQSHGESLINLSYRIKPVLY